MERVEQFLILESCELLPIFFFYFLFHDLSYRCNRMCNDRCRDARRLLDLSRCEHSPMPMTSTLATQESIDGTADITAATTKTIQCTTLTSGITTSFTTTLVGTGIQTGTHRFHRMATCTEQVATHVTETSTIWDTFLHGIT